MDITQIIGQLKEFYPVGISLDDIVAYAGSEPYQKKKSCIDKAWSDRNQWDLLKDSLSDLSTEIGDYSFMGGSPWLVKNGHIYSLFYTDLVENSSYICF